MGDSFFFGHCVCREFDTPPLPYVLWSAPVGRLVILTVALVKFYLKQVTGTQSWVFYIGKRTFS